MFHSRFRPLARTLPVSLLLLTACQALPAISPTPPPEGAPSVPPSQVAPSEQRPASEWRLPGDDNLPQLVRPTWDGTQKDPVPSKTLAFPTTWKGDLTIRDLAMVGQTLYTADRTLQAVPVAGGTWSPVAISGVTGLTRLASDGAHLFAGTDQGQVVGLDPANGKSATLATLPSAVTALKVGPNALWVGTAQDGVYRVSMTGGAPQPLAASEASPRRVQDLALGNQVVYTLGDRLYAWPMDGSSARRVPGTDGAMSLTAYRGVAFVGTADGWVLCSEDDGTSTHALGRMVETPLTALGTDGAWLYSSSGNTTYMLDLKQFRHSLCHAGFPATVSNLTVMDGATVLVGTRAKGLTSMPR